MFRAFNNQEESKELCCCWVFWLFWSERVGLIIIVGTCYGSDFKWHGSTGTQTKDLESNVFSHVFYPFCKCVHVGERSQRHAAELRCDFALLRRLAVRCSVYLNPVWQHHFHLTSRWLPALGASPPPLNGVAYPCKSRLRTGSHMSSNLRNETQE